MNAKEHAGVSTLTLDVYWASGQSGDAALDAHIAGCSRCRAYLAVAVPIYLFFGFLDRLYQFYRFGSFTNTYVSLFAKEQRLQDPTLPANFPWTTPFWEGVLGPLFKPEKSIFLFDPLLVLALVLLVMLWKRLSPEVRAYGLASLFLLLIYICFYAKYTYWAGDFAWGDR